MSRVSRDSLDVYLFSLVFPRFPMLTQYLSLCPGRILIYHPPIMPNAHLASPRIPYAHLASHQWLSYFCAHRKYAGRHVVPFLPFKFSRKVSFQSFKKTHQKTKLDLNLTLDLGPLGQTKWFSQGFICHIAQGLCSDFSFIAPKL